MLKLILTKFWPAFIPIIVYVIWKKLSKNKTDYRDISTEENNDESVIIDADKIEDNKMDSALFATVVFSLLIMAGCFIWMGLTKHTDPTGQYTSPQFIDGKIIDGHIDRSQK